MSVADSSAKCPRCFSVPCLCRGIGPMPSCVCCGDEYRMTGCVRGYRCSCHPDFCRNCGKCRNHCGCSESIVPEPTNEARDVVGAGPRTLALLKKQKE